jgi:hypothetical protein
LISSVLTIYLTASTSFVTRKDSGVLSPNFATPTENHKVSAPPSAPPAKRMVLYYAAGSGIPEIKTILSGVWIMSAGFGAGNNFILTICMQALLYMVTSEVAHSLSRPLD